MNINEMTIAQLKERLAEADEIRKALNMEMTPSSNRDDSHWKIGSLYFIRTVTHHHCGKLIKVTDLELVFEDAAWVADDGRFNELFKTGEPDEVEPFPEGEITIVGRGALIDATPWQHPPLREVK